MSKTSNFLLVFIIALTLTFSCGKDGKSPTDSGDPGGGNTISIQDITFVTIHGGSFLIGNIENDTQSLDEKPVHDVSLPSFNMSIYEVTQIQYQAMMGSNPSYDRGVGDTFPVYNVNWYDAARFCNALSDAAGFDRCYDDGSWTCDFSKNGIRLPTEAEWEYACRAGEETKYNTGVSESDLGRAGWYSGNSSNISHPVGEKEENAWGLYDMHGNVWELCNDFYDKDYYSLFLSTDPTGPSSGSFRVVRGGSWFTPADHCRASYRRDSNPDRGFDFVGFRVVHRP